MAMASSNMIQLHTPQQQRGFQVFCRKKEKDYRENSNYPFKVIEITPPPNNLGIRCFPSNMQCGECNNRRPDLHGLFCNASLSASKREVRT